MQQSQVPDIKGNCHYVSFPYIYSNNWIYCISFTHTSFTSKTRWYNDSRLSFLLMLTSTWLNWYRQDWGCCSQWTWRCPWPLWSAWWLWWCGTSALVTRHCLAAVSGEAGVSGWPASWAASRPPSSSPSTCWHWGGLWKKRGIFHTDVGGREYKHVTFPPYFLLFFSSLMV